VDCFWLDYAWRDGVFKGDECTLVLMKLEYERRRSVTDADTEQDRAGGDNPDGNAQHNGSQSNT
jgi:hypothetical protein